MHEDTWGKHDVRRQASGSGSARDVQEIICESHAPPRTLLGNTQARHFDGNMKKKAVNRGGHNNIKP